MAFERNTTEKMKGSSLEAFVTNMSKVYSNQMAIRNAEDELEFNRIVLEEDVSLEDQLEYRREQLKRVSDDPTERKRIRAEISTLRQRVSQKEFSDEYLGKLIDFNSGLSSIDSLITYLRGQKESTNDPETVAAIDKQLAGLATQKFNSTKDLIQNETDYALKDKTASIIDTQIGKVSSAKAKATLSGDQTLVSMYDLQLQALSKAKTENQIEKSMKNFAVSNITGFASASKLLDAYNSEIANSPVTGAVKIGDVNYASPREFWSFKRDSYVADQSSSGFFSRLGGEVSNRLKLLASQNALTTDALRNETRIFDTIGTRPELAGYEANLSSTKQDTLQSGADLLSNSVLNTYSRNSDINQALGTLSALKSLGVNVDAAYTQIITKGASTKSGQVNDILQAAQDALQNNPGITPDQAIQMALQSGAGVVLSPEELTKKKEGDIATDLSKKAQEGTFSNDPRTTIAPPSVVTPTQTPTPSSGARSIVVKQGDTLSAIAARELGSASRFNEIVALNGISDPNKIQIGQTIKLPGETQTPTPTPTTPSAPISTPTPTPTPTPTITPSPQVTAPAATTPSPLSQPTSKTYTVKSGDTLSAIAMNNLGSSSRYTEIAKLNNLADPNKIQIGMILKLPT